MENLNLLQAKLSQLVGQTCIDTVASLPQHRFGIYVIVFTDMRVIVNCDWSLKVEQLELVSSSDVDAVEDPYHLRPDLKLDDFVDDTRKIRRFLHGRLVGRAVTNVVLDTKTLELDLQFNVLHLRLLPTINKYFSYDISWNISQYSSQHLMLKGISEILFGHIIGDG
jgi:hypothetical protein